MMLMFSLGFASGVVMMMVGLAVLTRIEARRVERAMVKLNQAFREDDEG